MSETLTAPESPYKGLAPFEDSELDALLFFGRERERDIIAANLTAYRLTVLYGASGVGKSSVLRAGVAYSLRRRGDVVVVFSTWSGDPVAGLLAETHAALVEQFGEERVAPPGDRLAGSLSAWTQELECDLYVVLDQVDEYFLYQAEDDDFAEQFAEAARQEDLRVNFLISIREDMLAKLDRFKGRIPNLFSNYLRLDHLDRDAARAAIVGPIDRYNELVTPEVSVGIEPGLVDAVLAQTAVQGTEVSGLIEAPYLQLVMERLWEQERAEGSRTLRGATLEALGGARTVVEAHLTDALDRLGVPERELAASLFNHLVTPSGTKISHRLGDLAQYAGAGESQVLPVVTTLIDQRILRPVEESGAGRSSRYEIFHDVLAEPVAAWRDRHAAERKVRELERRRRRLLAVTGMSLVALAAMALVTVFAFNQRQEAQEQRRESEVRELTERANALIDVDPERAAGLAVDAAQRETTLALENTLRSALVRMHGRAILSGGGGRLWDAEFNPSGSHLVITSEREVRIYRARPPTLVHRVATGMRSRDAEFSPDGRLVATASHDGVARLWNVDAGTVDKRFTHERPVRSVSFSGDGGLLATGSNDGEAKVWNTATGLTIATFEHPRPVERVVLSESGTRLVTVTARSGSRGERFARLLDVRSGRLVARLSHDAGVVAAAFGSHGGLVVTAGYDETARVWDARTGDLRNALRGAGSTLVDVAVSRGGGSVLAAGGVAGQAWLWDVPSGALRMVFTGHDNDVTTASFSPDENWVATSSPDNSARVWWASGRVESVLRGHAADVTKAVFSPDGRTVLTASSDGSARLWDPFTDPRFDRVGGHHGEAVSASFSPNGRLALSAGADGARLSSLSGDRVTVLDRTAVNAALFAARGRIVVTAGADGNGRIWRARDGVLAYIVSHGSPITSLAVAPRTAVIATGSANGAIRLWTRTGRPLQEFAFEGGVTSLSFAPDGALLVGGSTTGVATVWRVANGQTVRRLRGHSDAITDAAFSPDGRFIVTASEDRSARIWSARTGARLHILEDDAAVLALAINPLGTLVVTTSLDGDVRMWRLPDGDRVADLKRHFTAVEAAAFSADGRWLVTAGPFSTGVWNVRTAQPLFFVRGNTKPLSAVAFSPGGWRILTASRDGGIRTYDCTLCAPLSGLMQIARARLQRLSRAR